jgi:hypothetical protein
LSGPGIERASSPSARDFGPPSCRRLGPRAENCSGPKACCHDQPWRSDAQLHHASSPVAATLRDRAAIAPIPGRIVSADIASEPVSISWSADFSLPATCSYTQPLRGAVLYSTARAPQHTGFAAPMPFPGAARDSRRHRSLPKADRASQRLPASAGSVPCGTAQPGRRPISTPSGVSPFHGRMT